MGLYRGNTIAVILPCYNEAPVVGDVVAGFRAALPEASIHVFDNGSTDGTREAALAADAEVHHVGPRGKGNVVRCMFADVEADIYVMADGDGTYDSGAARGLVDALIDGNLDMVVGTRMPAGDGGEYRFGHQAGNRVLTGMVAHIFGQGFTDMLSGYRVLSRRYVKSFPALSRGFEIETELTIHALELRAPYAEIETSYGSRIEGSDSKLDTVGDGLGILKSIIRLYVRERPRQLYLASTLGLICLSLLLGIPVVIEFWQTGLVSRLPTAIAAGFVMVAAMISGACAVILDSVVTARKETKRLSYLAIPSVRGKQKL